MRSSTSKAMVRIREERIDFAISAGEKELAKKQKEQRERTEKIKMKEVIEFFEQVCPLKLSDETKRLINKPLDGAGTKNVIGMINHINDCLGDLWPEWRQIALEHYGFRL